MVYTIPPTSFRTIRNTASPWRITGTRFRFFESWLDCLGVRSRRHNQHDFWMRQQTPRRKQSRRQGNKEATINRTEAIDGLIERAFFDLDSCESAPINGSKMKEKESRAGSSWCEMLICETTGFRSFVKQYRAQNNNQTAQRYTTSGPSEV